jgi:hypothetical protein
VVGAKANNKWTFVNSQVVSTNNVYKHSQKTVSKHWFGLIEDYGNQGYDITYNVIKNNFTDNEGNESFTYNYRVTNINPTWHSSSGNMGVITFALTTVVYQMY